MGGSALKQLKTKLREQNLERRDTGKNKKGKQQKQREIDPASRQEKLSALHDQFNTFDLKFIKRKHDVGQSRKDKGKSVVVAGKPALAKSTAIENRRKSLLPELLDRRRTGGVVDRRFGENNPHLTPEEKALARFTAERQRLLTGKGQKFNLAEEDELTHYGRSLALDEGGRSLAPQDDAFEFSQGANKRPFDSNTDGQDEDEPAHKKSRTEIMNEVIAKSKAYKYERQKARTEDEDLRFALDNELDDLRVALGQAPQRKRKSESKVLLDGNENADQASADRESSASLSEEKDEASDAATDEDEDEDKDENEDSEDLDIADALSVNSAQAAKSAKTSTNPSKVQITFVRPDESEPSVVDRAVLEKLLSSKGDVETLEKKATKTNTGESKEIEEEDSYDAFVRMLSFEKRAKPSDRLKTEMEQIKEAAESLKKAEAARLRRMQGIESDSDEEGGKKRRHVKQSQADDLDDDFDLRNDSGDEVVGDGRDGTESGAFRLQPDESAELAAIDSESERDVGELGNIDAQVEDEDEDEGEDEDEDEDQDEAMWESQSKQEAGDMQPLVDNIQRPSSKVKGAEDSFVLDMPSSHADFLSMVDSMSANALDTAISRIRTLFHPRLAEENNTRLATFAGILLDHAIYLASISPSDVESINKLTPHILSLSKAYPLASARHFVAKLTLMQKNFVRGLQNGPMNEAARTWPTFAELVVLRLIGIVWSTSDFSNPVAAPALLLIGQYLSQARIRSQADLSSGLFLCTLVLQYEETSKRICPEVLNFLAQALCILTPAPSTAPSMQMNALYMPDAFRADLAHLKVRSKQSCDQESRPVCCSDDTRDLPHIFGVVLSLTNKMAELWVSHAGFIEMIEPVLAICSQVSETNIPQPLLSKLESTKGQLTRMLNLARKSRRPLRLQHFKPVPIATYAPKFEDGYRPGSHAFDPDTARNETAKLKALVKKEKKGAVRELRKDNRFIAEEKAKMREAKAADYKSKISSIKSGLQLERKEEKDYERTKQRLRARDKKRARPC